jgi:branched-chain amino acid transport system permease protein
MSRQRLGWVVGLVALALAAVFPLLVKSAVWQNTLILMLMLAQLGVAWNILGGYAGQVSLGHAAFFGTGAYVSTLLALRFGITPWVGMFAGAGVSAALAVAIGWPCFRLKGHYFAMATIAVGEIVQAVVNGWDLLGGAVGLNLPMQNTGWWFMVFNRSKLPYHYIALGLLLFTLGVNWLVTRSHVGYYLRAIKDEPDAARSLGVSLTRYKLYAIALSSGLAAMGGTLYAQKELLIDPGSTLSTSLSIKMSLVAIMGGVGTLAGPVVGAVLLTTIEEASRTAFGGTGRGTDMVVYGLLIVLIAIYQPAGVLGWIKQRFPPRAATPAPATPAPGPGAAR